MIKFKISWLQRFGIGGRLFLAFVLISSITLLVSALSTQTYLHLRDQLHLLEKQDIPGLDAAARLNDKSRLIVAMAPLLVTAESNLLRRQTMQKLNTAIASMDSLMRNLPAYDHYFRELIAQIKNSLLLLNQSVEHREQRLLELSRQSAQLSPLFIKIIDALEKDLSWPVEQDKLSVINKLFYFSGSVVNIDSASSFHSLDARFLRLEKLGAQIQQRLNHASPAFYNSILHSNINTFLSYGDRQGAIFILQNRQLDMRHQQSFLLQNSLQHIHQLAAQVNLYTDSTNNRISQALQRAIASINRNMQSNLLLSLFSLLIAGAISWFYVRRNVLQRILELQQNMRSIASAKLDTKIRILGNDEVSAMAIDLQHFQKTAIQVERSNRQLAAQIEVRMLAEQQLQASQNELVQAAKLAALGQLSVGITHEISQPLTAIASHLHIAGLRLQNQQLESVQRSHEKIRHLLNKVTVITRHLKSFARKAATEMSPVNLQCVITDAIDLMASRMREQKCQLNYNPQATSPIVMAESIRLEQVLINLLSNALDAVQDTQQRKIDIRVIAHEHECWIEVQDSGIGMPDEQLQSIFDPFYSRKKVGEGLGLGLSISYNIIQDFGGQIRVTSEPNQGSCFSVILKLAEAK